MHLIALSCILLVSWSSLQQISATPESANRAFRVAYFNSPNSIKSLENLQANPAINAEYDEDEYEEEDENTMDSARKTSSASTGRLFFRGLFGRQQPIIPIIITGGAGNANTPTSTGTIPTASGTITTAAGRNYDTEDDESREGDVGESEDTEDTQQYAQLQVQGNGGESIPAKLEIGNANKSNKVLTVRIPPKYRKYFQNGQKVYLRKPNNNRRRNRPTRNRRRRNRN